LRPDKKGLFFSLIKKQTKRPIGKLPTQAAAGGGDRWHWATRAPKEEDSREWGMEKALTWPTT